MGRFPVEPQRPLGGRVRLLVHGVGGTPPTSMLATERPVQLAGDHVAGCFRRPTLAGPGDTEEEAYTWGGLTSRSVVRALWILLLPFTLVNLAGWMLIRRDRDEHGASPGAGGAVPQGDGQPDVAAPGPIGGFAARGRMGAVVRLLAVAATLTAILFASSIVTDLVALQCLTHTVCAQEHWWLGWADWSLLTDWPYRLVVAAQVPVVVVLAGLWWLARHTRQGFEEFPGPPDAPVGTSRLATEPLWTSGFEVRVLALIHEAATVYALLAALNWAFASHAGTLTGVPAVLAAISVVAALLMLAAVARPGWLVASQRRAGAETGSNPAWQAWRSSKTVSRSILGGQFVIFAAMLAWAWLSGPTTAEVAAAPGGMDGLRRVVANRLWWMSFPLVLVLLAVLLAALVAQRKRHGRAEGVAMGGFGPFVSATLGFMLIGTGGAGVALWLAEFLGRRAGTAGEGVGIVLFSDYAVLALSALVLAVLVLALVVAFGVATWRRWDTLDRTAPGITPDLQHRLLVVLHDRWVPFYLPVLLATAAAITATIAMVYGIDVRAFDGRVTGRILSADAVTNGGLDLASRVMLLGLLVAVGVIVQSLRNPGQRRLVGILWDVATFWPRWFHPLAPPSYAARAVPELRDRLVALTSADDGAVLVAAHSQGTVVAAATLLRTPPQARARVALLTYGSPLRWLYGRFFPDYFNAVAMGEVYEAVGGRWRNLYRPTDPIGGPVLPQSPTGDAVDLAVDDPVAPAALWGVGDPFEHARSVTPFSRGHSGYQHDPTFDHEATQLLDAVVVHGAVMTRRADGGSDLSGR